MAPSFRIANLFLVAALFAGVPGRVQAVVRQETGTEPPRPLKVFILAGQSNMQGHARVSTFRSMAGDPATKDLLAKMSDGEGKPLACERHFDGPVLISRRSRTTKTATILATEFLAAA